LPQKWRVRLAQAGSATLTVLIEEEVQAVPAEELVTDDPLFGMWRDREDMADVPAMCVSCAPRGSMTMAHGATADDGADRLRCAGVESLHALPAWRISAVTYIELAQGCRDKTELARLKKGLAASSTVIVQITPATSQQAAELIDILALSHGMRLADPASARDRARFHLAGGIADVFGLDRLP